MLFIALLTLVPGKNIPHFIDWNLFNLDKIIHFIIFFILAYLGVVFFNQRSNKFVAALIFSSIIALLYGSLIEYLQTFIPDRGFDYADLSANTIGIVCGILISSFTLNRSPS